MDKDLDLGNRIAWLRKDRGLEQKEAASAIGINYGTYQHYEYGNHPSRKLLSFILQFYGCDKSWLLTGEGVPYPDRPPEQQAPSASAEPSAPAKSLDLSDEFVLVKRVRGMISAGGGLAPDNSVDMQLAFRRDFINRKGNPDNMSLIKVSGDSMEPTLLSGDLVLVDHSRTTIAPQGGIYAIAIDHEIMIKRVQFLLPQRKLKIISDNKQYEPMETDSDQVRINGKVIWYGRDLER